ncbi:MAG: hypothetical protein EA368_10705 [Leptolyngbya sp. DLM2.Bin27]|nr:MAG: hypothetical protein EA368_10705 [Leptolyngbya sp. DLM2.Bin27]
MTTNRPFSDRVTHEKALFKAIARVANKLRNFVRLLWGDPSFLVMSWLARFVAVRETVARRGSYEPSGTIEATVMHAVAGVCPVESPAQVAALIRANGYYEGFSLRPDILAGLLDFAQTNPCYVNRNPDHPFYIDDREQLEQTLGAPILVAGYLDSHESCAAYQAMRADNYLLDVASQYLNHRAVYMRGELAWGFPAPNTLEQKLKMARVYHCDINDYKTIKFFFYLSDVRAGDGPHVYLQGTHLHRRFRHQWLGQGCASICDRTLVDIYGSERVRIVTGPAGFGFAGDPYCLHRGTVPQHSSRLLLQLEYGMNPYRIWYFSGL